MKDAIDTIRKMLANGNNVILLHSNADPDCVGSAAALAHYYGIKRIVAPEGVSHLGKRLLASLNLETESNIEPEGVDHFFVVDAQDDSSLGYKGTPWDSALIIDHHKAKSDFSKPISIIDENANSTCEIVWEILGRPKEISGEIGRALMAGIISDTGHLKRGDHATFRTVSEILEASGLIMEDILEMFEIADDQDMSRKISRLKGAQRLKFDRVGDWIVAITDVGAFESAVCHALLSLGADVAFSGSQKDDEFRITGRANSHAITAGIHLGEMFGKIASECNGEGGGHDGAAGLSGTGDAEAILGICMHNAITALKGRKKASRVKEENVL